MNRREWFAEIETDYETVLRLLHASGALLEGETSLPSNSYALEQRVVKKGFGLPRELLGLVIQAHSLIDIAIIAWVSEDFDHAIVAVYKFAKVFSQLDSLIEGDLQKKLQQASNKRQTAPARDAAKQKAEAAAERRDVEIEKRGIELLQQGKSPSNLTSIILREMQLSPERFGLKKAVSESTVRGVLQRKGLAPKNNP